MNRDTLLLIISILIMVAFEAYTAISGSNPGKLVLSLPLVSILTTFLLFIYLISKAEQRLSQTLDRRLPVFEYIDSRKEVEIEITQLAGQASELIVATGGRSRNREYLQVIEHKVRSGDLTYWRLIYNRPITHEMCEHIFQLFLTQM
jgi:hypothetical protein